MIREATSADVPRLVSMGREFLAQGPYRDVLAENPDQMGRLAERLIADPNGVVMVYERDGLVCGMLGLICFDHPMSAQPTASELFYWIEPAMRGSGVRLLRAAEAWVYDRGITRMQMIAPDARVGAFYRRMGYTEMETAFQRDLTCSPH